MEFRSGPLSFVAVACAWLLANQVQLAHALTVNPPIPIQHRVNVQIIESSLADGMESATVLGTSQQQTDIEHAIDLIWAQAGIDVNFQPNVNTYGNDFAYQGIDSPRPQSDLTAILNTARAAGVLNPDPSVLNMFFVRVVPGFSEQGKYAVSGIGRIAGNGMAIYVGDALLSTQTNRELVAGVVAHEIGHNLGLPHTESGIANLMSPNGTTDQLEPTQVTTVLQSGAAWLSGVEQTADFTGDGWVDISDLLLWQASYAHTSAGDSDQDGDSDGLDFLAWQKQYSTVGLDTKGRSVPEPQAIAMLAAWILLAAGSRTGSGRR